MNNILEVYLKLLHEGEIPKSIIKQIKHLDKGLQRVGNKISKAMSRKIKQVSQK